MSNALLIGTVVKDPGGAKWTIGAILWTGERYYMMTDKHGVVSLMPASEVERWDWVISTAPKAARV